MSSAGGGAAAVKATTGGSDGGGAGVAGGATAGAVGAVGAAGAGCAGGAGAAVTVVVGAVTTGAAAAAAATAGAAGVAMTIGLSGGVWLGEAGCGAGCGAGAAGAGVGCGEGVGVGVRGFAGGAGTRLCGEDLRGGGAERVGGAAGLESEAAYPRCITSYFPAREAFAATTRWTGDRCGRALRFGRVGLTARRRSGGGCCDQ